MTRQKFIKRTKKQEGGENAKECISHAGCQMNYK